MSHLTALFLFVGFAALAITAALAPASDKPGRLTNLFIGWTLCASLAAGFSHRDSWPFSSWNVFPEKAGQIAYAVRVRALDASGAEHDIDWRAWQPFAVMELYSWLDFDLPRLNEPDRSIAAAWLLDKAETGRLRAAQGLSIGSFDKWFGPLTAPLHVLYRDRWDSPATTPRLPFRGIRIYRERYDIRLRAVRPDAVWRDSICEWQQPS